MTSLYHEKQLSSLCGVHALNNMLQGPYFGAGDLAQLALRLDEAEQNLLDERASAMVEARSHRIDQNTGDFSIDVLVAALEAHAVLLINVDHVSVAEAVSNSPEMEEAYLVHRSSHWFGIRKCASLWWNVDSKLPRPMLVAEEYLGPFIARLRLAGHTVHVVRGAPLPLPVDTAACSAGHEAVYHPLDYLLEHPSLDPATYRPEDYSHDDEDGESAAAAAALQASEWEGGRAAGGNDYSGLSPEDAAAARLAAGEPIGGADDSDAALAAALMEAEIEDQAELERRTKLRRAAQAAAAPFNGFPFFGLAAPAQAVGMPAAPLARHTVGGAAASAADAAPDGSGEDGIGAKVSAWFRGLVPPPPPPPPQRAATVPPAVGTLVPSANLTAVPYRYGVVATPNARRAAAPSVLHGRAVELPGAPQSLAMPAAPLALFSDETVAAAIAIAAASANVRGAGAPAPGPAPSVSVPDLIQMGFSFENVHAALTASGGNITAAQELLLEAAVAPPPFLTTTRQLPTTTTAATPMSAMSSPLQSPAAPQPAAAPLMCAAPFGLEPLPPGWHACTDPTYNRPYWFNTLTRQSTWSDPRVSAAQMPPPMPPPAVVQIQARQQASAAAPAALPRTRLPTDPNRGASASGPPLVLDPD